MAARWLFSWADSEAKPAIYHTVARVVDRRFAFASKRLSGLFSRAFVATELAAAREVVKQGFAPDGEVYVQRTYECFTYRMENLS